MLPESGSQKEHVMLIVRARRRRWQAVVHRAGRLAQNNKYTREFRFRLKAKLVCRKDLRHPF
ncbi:hypothetical protein SAMN06273570_5070 [Candidatus Pantoea floridensis]|uniref:Uncharacterized protein n=1 Tax=Candidatus Pantoea floridensis TaxID=1938870 RepID=A0A286DRW6_9GAMM|nr:hypothetical protein BX596_4974 [Enterobacteriaceae bacterium JKS000233]SOD61294.1 hypothetical protein SAMN06273570_5070 [Pantoea floridensis]